MSNTQNDIYLENKEQDFKEILANKEWEKVQAFYIQMENDGMGEFVPQISELMSDEDVKDYKQWDLVTNGSVETQTDDNS